MWPQNQRVADPTLDQRSDPLQNFSLLEPFDLLDDLRVRIPINPVPKNAIFLVLHFKNKLKNWHFKYNKS